MLPLPVIIVNINVICYGNSAVSYITVPIPVCDTKYPGFVIYKAKFKAKLDRLSIIYHLKI